MTRKECENAVLDKLEEIRDIITEFGLDRVMLSVNDTFVSVYLFNRDEEGNVAGGYVLDATKWIDGTEG